MNNKDRFKAGEIFYYGEIPSAKKDLNAVQIGPDFGQAVPTYLRWVIHDIEFSQEYVVIFNYVFGQYVELRLFFSEMTFLQPAGSWQYKSDVSCGWKDADKLDYEVYGTFESFTLSVTHLQPGGKTRLLSSSTGQEATAV